MIAVTGPAGIRHSYHGQSFRRTEDNLDIARNMTALKDPPRPPFVAKPPDLQEGSSNRSGHVISPIRTVQSRSGTRT